MCVSANKESKRLDLMVDFSLREMANCCGWAICEERKREERSSGSTEPGYFEVAADKMLLMPAGSNGKH